MIKYCGVYSSGHDANYCFINEENDLYHWELERTTRQKHQGTSLAPSELPWKLFKEVFELENSKIGYVINLSNYINFVIDGDLICDSFDDNFVGEYFIDHHFAHAAYSYYTRPTNMDKTDIFTYDGWGFLSDSAFYNSDLELVDNNIVGFGSLWTDITRLFYNDNLAFNSGKVMGWSAYGKFSKEIYNHYEQHNNLIKSFKVMKSHKIIKFNELKKYLYERNKKLEQAHYKITPNIDKLFKQDISKTLQQFTEDKIFDYLYKHRTCDNLCISGGCGLNGYINQKIQRLV